MAFFGRTAAGKWKNPGASSSESAEKPVEAGRWPKNRQPSRPAAIIHRAEVFTRPHDVADYQFDIYALFMEKALRLVRAHGVVGFITPNTWLNNQSCIKLRQLLLKQSTIVSIADYSRENVFPDAVVLPIVSVFQRSARPNNHVAIWRPIGGVPQVSHQIPQALWTSDQNRIFNVDLTENEAALRDRIMQECRPLKDFATVRFGIKIYETGKGTPPQKPAAATEKIFEATSKLDATYRRYLEGKDIVPYLTRWQKRWLKYGANLAAPRDPALFQGERLLFRRIVGQRLIGTLVTEDFVTGQLLQIVKPNPGESARFLLGILNSTLIAFLFRKTYNRADKISPEIRVYELESLPVAKIDRSKKTDRTAHDQLVALGARMLKLHTDLAAAKSPDAQTHLQRDIAATDRAIDALVYQLYGLTAAEIALVEKTAAAPE